MEVFLTDRSLHGTSLLPRYKSSKIQLNLNRQDQLSKVLDSAIQLGIKNLVCTSHPLLLSLLQKNKSRWPFKISMIVPNFQQFVRDTSHYGTVGTAVKRVLSMPFLGKLSLMKFGLLNVKGGLGMKFSVLMNVFLMTEISQFLHSLRKGTSIQVEKIFLHHQIADTALALKQFELFDIFKKLVYSYFGSEPGIITRNFVPLNIFLREHQIHFPWIVTPFNPRGYMMTPDSKSCEDTLREIMNEKRDLPKTKIVSDYCTLSGIVPADESVAYLNSHPFSGVMLEMTDIADTNLQNKIKNLLLKI